MVPTLASNHMRELSAPLNRSVYPKDALRRLGPSATRMTAKMSDQMREYAVQAVAAERERWRLRVLGLQAKYDDPACRAALKHAAAYGSQPEA